MTTNNVPINRSFRFRTIAVALSIALLLSACGKDNAEAEKQVKAEGEKGRSEEQQLTMTAEEATKAGIKVEPLKAENLASSISVTATIQADQDRIARVSPRTEARITSAPAKLGDLVRAGEVLASLDSIDVGEAYANLVQAQSELRIAEADLQRAQILVADEIIPRKDFLRAQSERDKASAGVRAATDKLRMLGGNPAAADRGVSGFSVTSPFAGTVIEKKATVGDLASPSAPLFTVADLSRVWIVADLPEAAIAKVRVGARAKVSVTSFPSEQFGGRVSHIGSVLNKETRTVAARVEVPNNDGRLKPDMFATATIEVSGDISAVMSVPDEAVVLMEGQQTVFVYEKGAYVPRAVNPGERIGGRTVLKAGIAPGEQVVTAGAYALKARKLKSQAGGGH